MKKYPIHLVNQEFNSVFFLSIVDYYGSRIVGMYDYPTKSIFLAIPNKKFLINRRLVDIESTFHHEVSSILMKSYHFSEALWRQALGEEFLYKSDENPFYFTSYVRGQEKREKYEDLLSRGLFNQYSETGVENNFNTYAEVVFTQPKKMKKLIDQYPIIQRKYEVFKSFYLGIDKGFAPVFAKING